MSTAVFGAPGFKARSGRKVVQREDGSVSFHLGNGYIGADVAMDAEEFFQAKRDAELGRWRDPLNPNYVVYPLADDAVMVFREHMGTSEKYSRAEAGDDSGYLPRSAAFRYFEAHPEQLPWDGAEVGEIWAVTINGREVPCRVIKPAVTNGIAFLPVDTLGAAWFAPSPLVTAAERIWKADAS